MWVSEISGTLLLFFLQGDSTTRGIYIGGPLFS